MCLGERRQNRTTFQMLKCLNIGCFFSVACKHQPKYNEGKYPAWLMTDKPTFPGMNPYLEHPALWPEVHYGIIGGLIRTLNPQITPKYRAAVDKRVYMDTLLVGIPDNTVFQQISGIQSPAGASNKPTAVVSKPERVTVPMVEEVTERYLEIREVMTHKVITVIELLSPKNKRGGEGRKQYLSKRQSVLNSQTHFVEVDLLRTGEPMPIEGGRKSDYQILVSRAKERPAAERYPFNLKDPIPCFLLPLQAEDEEPVIDLRQLILQACDEAAIELAIDYTQLPTPPLSEEDTTWMKTLTQNR